MEVSGKLAGRKKEISFSGGKEGDRCCRGKREESPAE
jgi:hypothetical protein